MNTIFHQFLLDRLQLQGAGDNKAPALLRAANCPGLLEIGLFHRRVWHDDRGTLLTGRPAYIGQKNRQQTE